MPVRTPLSLEGEGWGEGEHTALVVIPFTLCSLLLCYGMTCERGMAAQSPLRGALGLFLLACRGFLSRRGEGTVSPKARVSEAPLGKRGQRRQDP